MKTFVPQKVYYEPRSRDYSLGKSLLERYEALGVPMEEIENHNNIESLRTRENADFPKLKRVLVIGTRKTHKYADNHKVSDYLVPYTSSGCTAMCLYCYLVCHYNKCAYLRLFVNREEMLSRMIRKAQSYPDEKVFEIGSNSDLILENTLTDNLVWTIENFTRQSRGKLTFPTKFHMVDPLLTLDHQKRVICRVSVNPQEIITKTEFGTSNLTDRIAAVNRLCHAGYPVGLLVAPVIFVENWQRLYAELFQRLAKELSEEAKESLFFEVIFMTYSYIHDRINQEAFPKALPLFDKNLMTGRGVGKYWYKPSVRAEGETFIRALLAEHFPQNELLYIV